MTQATLLSRRDMRNLLIGLFLLGFLALMSSMWSIEVDATIYYVSMNSGSDASADPTNILTPWQTTNAIRSKTFFNPGDRIRFKAGESWRNYEWAFLSSGTPGNPIVFEPYGTGEKPDIGAFRTNYTHPIRRHDLQFNDVKFSPVFPINQGAIDVKAAYNIDFNNIEVDGRNYGRDAVVVGGDTINLVWAENINFYKPTIYDSGSFGSGVWSCINFVSGSRDSIVVDPTLYGCEEVCVQAYTRTGVDIQSGMTTDNISVTGGSCIGDSVAYGGCANAGWGSNNFYVDGMTCTRSNYGFSADSYSDNTTFVNNISIDSLLAFQIITNTALGAVGNGGNANSVDIFNNTIIDTPNRLMTDVLYINTGNSRTTDIDFKNNILYGNYQFLQLIDIEDHNLADLDSDYNMLYVTSATTCASQFNYESAGKTFAQWKALGYDTNSSCSNAKLMTDYSLYGGSPAISAGVDLSIYFTNDKAGFHRPLGAGWEIGAYEYERPLILRGVTIK